MGSSDASIPFASEMMSGGLIRSFQYLTISSNTSLVSVDGSPLTMMLASQTASCRLVMTLSEQSGVSSMLRQKPSRRISSAWSVRSRSRASTYLRYAQWRMRWRSTSSWALMTSKRRSASVRSTARSVRCHTRTCTRSWYASCSSTQKALPHAPAPTPTTHSGSPSASPSRHRSSSSLASAPVADSSWRLVLGLWMELRGGGTLKDIPDRIGHKRKETHAGKCGRHG
jgi:hypothetical protein